MATHSNILAWEIPWTEEPGLAGYSPWDCKESYMTEHTCVYMHTHTHTQNDGGEAGDIWTPG